MDSQTEPGPAPVPEAPTMTVEAPPTTEDPYYLQLLAEERPSSEALGLLNQIDQVLGLDDAHDIVERAVQDLRLGLQGWCRAARRGVAAHEAEAIDAERRFRLRQLAAKEAELAATRCRMEALEGEKEHLNTVIERCAVALASRQAQLSDLLLLNRFFSSWRGAAKRSRALRMKVARYLERAKGEDLARRALRGWRDAALKEALVRQRTRAEEALARQKAALEGSAGLERAAFLSDIASLRATVEDERRMRVKLEEDMRQAFMRGVTALNLEAISVLKRGVPHAAHNPPGPFVPAETAPAASTSEPPFGFSSGPNVTAVDVNRMTAADIGSLVSRALGGGAGAAGLARPAPEPRPVAAAPQPYR